MELLFTSIPHTIFTTKVNALAVSQAEFHHICSQVEIQAVDQRFFFFPSRFRQTILANRPRTSFSGTFLRTYGSRLCRLSSANRRVHYIRKMAVLRVCV